MNGRKRFLRKYDVQKGRLSWCKDRWDVSPRKSVAVLGVGLCWVAMAGDRVVTGRTRDAGRLLANKIDRPRSRAQKTEAGRAKAKGLGTQHW
jgi:hypothetical protein